MKISYQNKELHNIGRIVTKFDITEEENVFPIVPPGVNNTDAVITK